MRSPVPSNYFTIPGIIKPVKKCLPSGIIIEEVCIYFGVPKHRVSLRTRTQEIVLSRHFSMLMLSIYTHLSLRLIGELFKRDHSSVLYAKRTVKGYISAKADNKYKAYYKDIKEILDAM